MRTSIQLGSVLGRWYSNTAPLSFNRPAAPREPRETHSQLQNTKRYICCCQVQAQLQLAFIALDEPRG